jgi:hypothetical protein
VSLRAMVKHCPHRFARSLAGFGSDSSLDRRSPRRFARSLAGFGSDSSLDRRSPHRFARSLAGRSFPWRIGLVCTREPSAHGTPLVSSRFANERAQRCGWRQAAVPTDARDIAASKTPWSPLGIRARERSVAGGVLVR